MPNHLHIIWEMLRKNGKEMPYASFNKFTSHQFLHNLRTRYPTELSPYEETDVDRKHRFWQRDPLAVRMDSKEKVEQKLEYIHLNPLQEHWSLVTKPEDYPWSSAQFYETGIDQFKMITDYRERFWIQLRNLISIVGFGLWGWVSVCEDTDRGHTKPEDYLGHHAQFYETGIDKFKMITDYRGEVLNSASESDFSRGFRSVKTQTEGNTEYGTPITSDYPSKNCQENQIPLNQ